MNVNIDNLEHVLSTLTGFESLSSGDLTSPDSVYAKTVLKLNGVDFKGREGSEGFGNFIKESGRKIVEMIESLVKSVKEFYFSFKATQTDKKIETVVKKVSEVTREVKKVPDIDTVVEKVSEEIQPAAKKITKLVSKEHVTVTFEPFVNFVTEYYNDLADVKTAGYKISAITGKMSLNAMGGKDLAMLDSFNKLRAATADEDYDGKIEGKILLDSLQRCEIVTTTANNFRDSAKDVLSAATKTAENYTSFYKTISNDPEKSELTEMVNEHLNNLGRCIVKLTNFVQALEAFIGNLGSAVARVGKLTTEENEGLTEALEDLKSE